MDLVTGGTGLVGSHVLLELALRRRPLRAIKRSESDPSMVKRVFQHYRPEEGMALFSGIEWVDAELHDLHGLSSAFEGVERIFHTAGMVSYDPRDRESLLEVNGEGTATMADLALEKGVKAFGYLSSTSALGKAKDGEPIDERAKWKVDHRNSDYSISKYMGEREIWRAREEGLSTIVLNPCIIIGPGDPGRSSTTLIQGVANGNPFFPPGSNAFVDVRDVAGPLVDLMESLDHEGERFVLIGENRSFKNVMSGIAKELGKSPPRFPAGRPFLEMAWRSESLLRPIFGKRPRITRHTARNAVKKQYYSSEKAERSFGFAPRSIDDAIRNACSFYKSLPKEKAL